MSSSGIKQRKQNMGFICINEYIIMVKRTVCIPLCQDEIGWIICTIYICYIKHLKPKHNHTLNLKYFKPAQFDRLFIDY